MAATKKAIHKTMMAPVELGGFQSLLLYAHRCCINFHFDARTEVLPPALYGVGKEDDWQVLGEERPRGVLAYAWSKSLRRSL